VCKEVDLDKFWDYQEGESHALRVIREVVACSLGFPSPNTVDCKECMYREECCAVNQGRLAAAKYRKATKGGFPVEYDMFEEDEEIDPGCQTDAETQIARWLEGRGYD